MEQRITLTINGQSVEARPGQTILDVVHEHKLDKIPTLCHSPELRPYGSCFVCVVEVEGRRTLVPACSTAVADNMVVHTNSERVLKSRKTAFELLLSNHFADCTSPCSEACPAGVDVQGYLALSSMGETKRALALIRESNPLPAICSRICVRRCEAKCRRKIVDEPVGINWVKRYLSDQAELYAEPVVRKESKGKSVGIVGAGPAGLTAAWFLGREGYDVTIYEAQAKSGGMLRYGIPTYRLPDAVIDAEVDYICQAGVKIVYQTEVGRDVSLDELRARHNALFLSLGAWAGKGMHVKGEYDTNGVYTGAEYLKRSQDNEAPNGDVVLVVGGGNTAMDVARTAWRRGAKRVAIIYRRTVAEMPADKAEIEDCRDEGIEILELTAPLETVKDENGNLKGLLCQRMALGEPDASGRRRPVPVEGSEYVVEGDLAISAIGQGPVLDCCITSDGALEQTKKATLMVNPCTLMTNINGVFAGGDVADDGPTVVIDAIGDGKRVAQSIAAFLENREMPKKPLAVHKSSLPKLDELGHFFDGHRRELHMLPVEQRRNNFNEVATGFTKEDADNESARCLSCGCVRYDTCALRIQAEEAGVDLTRFQGEARRHAIDDRHPFLVYDPNKCVLCARCIRTCARVLPIPALGLVNRGFKAEVRPAMNDPLATTACVSCGNCIDACPTGALTAKHSFKGRAALAHDVIDSHCVGCSVGCAIQVEVFGQNAFRIKGGSTPGSYICKNARFGHFANVEQAELAVNGEKATLDAAVSEIATKLKAVNANEIAVMTSPSLNNECLNELQSIVQALNVQNFKAGCRINRSETINAFVQSQIASPTDRSALKDADVILCTDTDLLSEHLVLASDVLLAVQDGAKLAVVNPIVDQRDHVAEISIAPRRGSTAPIWNAIAQNQTETNAASSEEIEKLAALIKSAQKLVVVTDLDRAVARSQADFEALLALMNTLPNVRWLVVRKEGNAVGLEKVMQNYSVAPLNFAEIKAVLAVGEGLCSHALANLPESAFVAAIAQNKAQAKRANVVIPMGHKLAEGGTRYTFDGREQTFAKALASNTGYTTLDVLSALKQKLA